MRLLDAHGSPLWLSYGMNVHPGGTRASTAAAIVATVIPLKERLGLSRHDPFGLAIRLSAPGVADTTGDDELRSLLQEHTLRVFTGNAFVLGAFHGEALKDAVYRPGWSKPQRVVYTKDFARTLAALSGGTEGELSLSTSPGHWRGWPAEPGRDERWAAHLVDVARTLARLQDEQGICVRLAIEPEPGCALQTTDELIAFFAGPLAIALEREGAHAERLRGFLGVCFDVCHQAVVHEDVASSLTKIADAQIPIVKLQASSALEVRQPRDARVRAELDSFDEPVYLHQVGVIHPRGVLEVIDDLPLALARTNLPDLWRVHFHVPVYRERMRDHLYTTRAQLIEALAWVRRHGGVSHIEVETYTWDVLPRDDTNGTHASSLVEALAQELEFVENELGTTRATA